MCDLLISAVVPVDQGNAMPVETANIALIDLRCQQRHKPCMQNGQIVVSQ